MLVFVPGQIVRPILFAIGGLVAGMLIGDFANVSLKRVLVLIVDLALFGTIAYQAHRKYKHLDYEPELSDRVWLIAPYITFGFGLVVGVLAIWSGV